MEIMKWSLSTFDDYKRYLSVLLSAYCFRRWCGVFKRKTSILQQPSRQFRGGILMQCWTPGGSCSPHKIMNGFQNSTLTSQCIPDFRDKPPSLFREYLYLFFHPFPSCWDGGFCLQRVRMPPPSPQPWPFRQLECRWDVLLGESRLPQMQEI